ncbi:MAG: membrane dipeptidase, partial [Bryocella sp.]
EALLDYRTPEIASAMGHGQRMYYDCMERRGYLKQLTDWPSMQAHVQRWTTDSNAPIGYVLSMESADPILDVGDAERWWEHGLRVVGLSHYGEGVYAHGTGSAGDGLTPRGFELLKRFETLGMIVDVTHLTDEGFWQVMNRYNGRVMASHHNCRALVPGQRQLTDDQIRALIDRGAVIGAAFDSWMLHPDYEFQVTDNSLVRLSDVVDHIDHICQLAGNAEHVAIGTDLDGGYGREQSPSDLDTIADVQQTVPIFQQRGYKDIEIANILHGNWLRFFRECWSGKPSSMA